MLGSWDLRSLALDDRAHIRKTPGGHLSLLPTADGKRTVVHKASGPALVDGDLCSQPATTSLVACCSLLLPARCCTVREAMRMRMMPMEQEMIDFSTSSFSSTSPDEVVVGRVASALVPVQPAVLKSARFLLFGGTNSRTLRLLMPALSVAWHLSVGYFVAMCLHQIDSSLTLAGWAFGVVMAIIRPAAFLLVLGKLRATATESGSLSKLLVGSNVSATAAHAIDKLRKKAVYGCCVVTIFWWVAMLVVITMLGPAVLSWVQVAAAVIMVPSTAGFFTLTFGIAFAVGSACTVVEDRARLLAEQIHSLESGEIDDDGLADQLYELQNAIFDAEAVAVPATICALALQGCLTPFTALLIAVGPQPPPDHWWTRFHVRYVIFAAVVIVPLAVIFATLMPAAKVRMKSLIPECQKRCGFQCGLTPFYCCPCCGGDGGICGRSITMCSS